MLPVSISTVNGANISLISLRPSSVINASPVTILPQKTLYSGDIFFTAVLDNSNNLLSALKYTDSSHG
jgi:hypothetical protein